MKEYCVYKHTSPSGKVYIGLTMQTPIRRWGKDGGGYIHQRYLSHAIKKYGWDNFKHEILFSGLTREEASLKEIEMIALHRSNQREFGYNVDGGGFSKNVSDETRRRMSVSHRGKKLSEEQKRKISVACKGHKTPYKGKPLSLEHRGKISEGLRGHIVTEETRLRLREKNVGRVITSEARAKMSESHKGLKPSVETVTKWKESNRYWMTPVEQLDKRTNTLINRFDSTMDAFRNTGVDPSTISACCRGKRKSAGGYKWCYPVETRELKSSAEK